MKTINSLLEISSRIEHLENSADWITRETVHTDNAISQTSTLISVLAEEIREKICALVHEMEETLSLDNIN